MQYFYSEEWDSESCYFDDLESRHIRKSLRKKSGEEIHVLNGLGSLFRCQIEVDAKGLVQGNLIDHRQFDPPKHQLHLAIGPTKNQGRLELLLEKATEMGLTRLLPMRCQHSERATLKMERLKKIAISAAKQSGNPYLPQIDDLLDFSKVIDIHGKWEGDKAIAYLSDKKELPRFDHRLLQQSRILLLIGPEGDFSPQEIELAEQNGFLGVSLGPLRLRTETAGIFAAATIYAMNL